VQHGDGCDFYPADMPQLQSVPADLEVDYPRRVQLQSGQLLHLMLAGGELRGMMCATARAVAVVPGGVHHQGRTIHPALALTCCRSVPKGPPRVVVKVVSVPAAVAQLPEFDWLAAGSCLTISTSQPIVQLYSPSQVRVMRAPQRSPALALAPPPQQREQRQQQQVDQEQQQQQQQPETAAVLAAGALQVCQDRAVACA
jgi:hypothetical protein